MLKMLIADDEPVIIQGLRMLLDWEQLGIEICAACDNGADALQRIFAHCPDLALLDISMPGKNGIEILKALHDTEVPTKVIFISGLQDFGYVQDALRYGAVDYLLKPVKKDALLRAVEKCLSLPPADTTETAGMPEDSYSRALGQVAKFEPGSYLLAAVCPLDLYSRSDVERQLIGFSIYGQLNTFCQQQDCGIAFRKKEQCYLLLVDKDQQQADTWLHAAQVAVEQRTNCRIGFVCSPVTQEMSAVPGFAAPCLDACRYFYFEGWLPDTVLHLHKLPFGNGMAADELRRLQDDIVNAFVEQNADAVQTGMDAYFDAVAQVSDGRQDTAVYHLLVCRQHVLDRLADAGIQSAKGSSDLLDTAREMPNYAALTKLFSASFDDLREQIAQTIHENDRQDIRKVTEYIAQHYRENLTLEVLARHIHMNSFYLSSYFKKQTGQNFKEYLNHIRMQHAMDLLLNTNMRSYEIAYEVGFRDHRYFNELFRRYYSKTPTAYRREFLTGQTVADDSEE